MPLDIDTIVASVEKTGRCVIVHEATRTGGFGAELAALVQEHCFYHLEAPIERVTGWDTPYPHAFEWDYFPGPARVAEALRRDHGGVSMGRYVFKLPDVGEGTAEAEIVAWHVTVGDRVDEDQPLVDVMTDKATVEMTVAGAPARSSSLHGEPGETMAVGSPWWCSKSKATGNAEGAQRARHADRSRSAGRSPPLGRDKGTRRRQSRLSSSGAKPAPAPQGVHSLCDAHAGRKAARLAGRARRRAEARHRAALRAGHRAGRPHHARRSRRLSSPPGRRRRDHGASAYAQRDGVEEIKIIGLRRKIAEQMQEAKRRIPHFAYVEEIDVTELEDLRAHLNATQARRRGPS